MPPVKECTGGDSLSQGGWKRFKLGLWKNTELNEGEEVARESIAFLGFCRCSSWLALQELRDSMVEELRSIWEDVECMPMDWPVPAQLCPPLPELSNLIKYQPLNKMQLFSRCCLLPQMEVHLGDRHSISRASDL
jgi:hypothetical protein